MRKVILSPEAGEDMMRLYDFALERELSGSTPNIDIPDRALALNLFMGRKIRSQFEREIVISFGRTGYVALYKVTDSAVIVGAVRHQLESDYH